jgi:hypothetical protein
MSFYLTCTGFGRISGQKNIPARVRRWNPKLFSTSTIQYKHRERRLYVDKGKVSLAYDEEVESFDDED